MAGSNDQDSRSEMLTKLCNHVDPAVAGNEPGQRREQHESPRYGDRQNTRA